MGGSRVHAEKHAFVFVAAEFRDADSMTISEVHTLLTHLVDNKKENDPAYNPSAMLQKTLAYSKRFSNVQSHAAIQQIRKCVCLPFS